MKINASGKRVIAVGIVMGFAMLLFLGSRIQEPTQQPRESYFPWRIEVFPDGSSRVFGITLGKSTLEDVQMLFRDTGDIKLFVSPKGRLAVEIFFDSVNLDRIRGKFVLGLSPGEKTMDAMLERGIRVKSMGDGARKVTLHPKDLTHIEHMPITAITYLPSADLDEEVIMKRFGEPKKRMKEDREGIVHWFYPHLGLDVVLNSKGKEVFQYVAPREFDRLRTGF
uniref:Uncharacterized protein n=1 Tax=Candidatus Kentrum sp. TC TaxID=2126339 RepID=A0A450YV77_9GAMM|nr:MAG: hypothetical protein BECKTC1821E_GA0114239_104816 [Candidatus Kentron sp. TC]VFK59506.1 MAG: hypothetical protein BECKTC1821F_GA0114240_103416 [Candidatus Kentron sp. TC]